MKETLEDKRMRIYNEYEAALGKVQSVRYEAIKELQQKRDKQLAELDNEAKGLYLSITHDCLFIKYIDDVIGWINQEGYCQFISTRPQLHDYENWIASGAKVNTSSEVQWRGRIYYLNREKELCSYKVAYEKTSFAGTVFHPEHRSECTAIYDFETCTAYESCLDENIKRHKHNLKPVIF